MSLVYIYDERLSVVKMYDTSLMGESTIDMKINEASTFYTKFEEQLPTNARYIAVQDPIANRRGINDEFLLYRLHSNQLGDDGLYEYTWTEFAYDELSFDGYITDKRPNDITFHDVLALVLAGTQWKVGLTNIEGTTSVNFYYESPMDAIKKINEKFPAEFRFWVRLADDGTIVERIVDAVKKRGQNTGRRFETTSNVLSVTAKEDLSNIYSAIVPRGKGEQVSEGGDDGADGHGRRITIKDVEWSKAKGDPVDKPLGQEWIALEHGEKLVDGRLRYKIVVFENDTDANQLASDGYAQLLKDSVPKIQLSGNASDLGVSELGDTVQVVDKSKHIEYEARIFRITYDLIDHTNTKVEFGDDIITSNSISSKIENITIKQETYQETVNWAIQQADGKNATYYNKTEPSGAVRDGDIWFKEQDNGTTQMYRYENGQWVARDSMDPQHILENFYKNGELDANRINVTNINAQNIIGKNAQFVRTSWDDAYDNSITIDPKAITLYADRGKPNEQTLTIGSGNIAFHYNASAYDHTYISNGAISMFKNGQNLMRLGAGAYGFGLPDRPTQDVTGIAIGAGKYNPANEMAFGISMDQDNGNAPQLVWAGHQAGRISTPYRTWENPAGWIIPENIRFSTWDTSASNVWFDNTVNVNMQAAEFRITHFNDNGIYAHKWQGNINNLGAIGMTTGHNQAGWAVTADDTWLFVHGRPYSVYKILSKVGML